MRLDSLNPYGEKNTSPLSAVNNTSINQKNIGIHENSAKAVVEDSDLRVSLLSEEELQKVLERIQVRLKYSNINAEYSVHERTKRIMVKLKDDISNEIIREIPPEKILDILAGLWEVAGLIIDEKV